MNESFRMADVSVNHFDSSPPESRVNKRIEVNDGNFPQKILPLAARSSSTRRARRAEEANQKDARRGVVGGVSRFLSLFLGSMPRDREAQRASTLESRFWSVRQTS